MYLHNIQCLDKETKGSYSQAVTGIIIVTLVVSVGLAILGVWEPELNGIEEKDYDMPFIPENKISEESSSESSIPTDLSEEIMTTSETSEEYFSDATISGTGNVLVLECGAVCDLDTKRGTLEIVDENLPCEPLPLCIDNDYLGNYWVLVESYGGYEFKGGYMVVKQKDCDDQFVKIVLIDSYFEHPNMMYKIGFELCDPSHPIVLESNHVPDIIGDWFCVIPDKELDKRVDLMFCTTWSGCFLPEQDFLVILAHKAMSQQKILNSR
ncbi:MAG: hypothetical protein ACFFBW_15755 [Promethearchaeota archaeon]